MLNKTINIFLAHFVCVCFLSADLNWWRPKEVPHINGYTDSYAVAMNASGAAIAIFDDKIFGSYDVNSNQWDFVQVDWSDTPQMENYQGVGNPEFSAGKSFKGTTIVLSALHEGWAIFTIPKGIHQGKIAVARYSSKKWQDPEILSDEIGGEPTIAQGYDGRAIAVWVNKEEKKEGQLMAAYYDGSAWNKQGSISTYTSIEMDYNQMGPQLVMSDLGDAVVIWKTKDKKAGEEDGALIAHYFDGVEEKWNGEELLGHQSLEKKGRDLKINFQGETFLVWDTENAIKAARMNLMKYMINQSDWGIALPDNKTKQKKEATSPWTVRTLAEGDELSTPKACVDRQGNAVVIWLNGYEGAGSAFFNNKEKSWETIQEPLSSQTAYATALHIDGANQARALWIGEGAALSEIICSRAFDFNAKKWGDLTVLNQDEENNSLIDAVEAVSLSKGSYGIVMWYDFFKERLFYAVLKEGTETPKNRRREGILYKKKMELAKRRAIRRANQQQ